MGSSKDFFCNLRVSLPRSWKYIHEYLRENKIFWGIGQGPKYYRFMQKNQTTQISCYCPFKRLSIFFWPGPISLLMSQAGVKSLSAVLQDWLNIQALHSVSSSICLLSSCPTWSFRDNKFAVWLIEDSIDARKQNRKVLAGQDRGQITRQEKAK